MSKKSRTENLSILQEFDYDSTDSEEEIDDTIGEVVNLNFEGFTAEEDDFNGIQRLLAQGLRGLDVNLTDLTDIIIAQNYVGCVIKEVIDDEKQAMEVDTDALEGEPDQQGDYIFGLNTIVNITQPKRSQSVYMAGLRDCILKQCEASGSCDETKELFRAGLTNKVEHVGLLINERLVNLPAEMSLPAFKTLLTEVEEANKIKMPFNFKYIILIAKVYKITKLKNKKKKNKKTGGAATGGAAAEALPSVKEVYANSEEEVLAEFAVSSFEYCVQDCSSLTADSWSDQEAMQRRVRPYRRVLLVPADKLQEALSKAEQQIAAE